MSNILNRLRMLNATTRCYQKVPEREFFYWLTIIFNRVDYERIQSVGPDRACAEWLLKNGASVRWKGFSENLKDYNKLPSEENRYYIQTVDATDSGITHVGFPYFEMPTSMKLAAFRVYLLLFNMEDSRRRKITSEYGQLHTCRHSCLGVYIDEIKLIRCFYLYNSALPLLSAVKDTLTTLEIKDCKSITDQGVRSLKNLKNLKTLKLAALPYLEDKALLRKELAEALPNCTIELE